MISGMHKIATHDGIEEWKPNKELKFLPEFVIPIINGSKHQTTRTSLNKIRKDDYIWAISKGVKFGILHINSIEIRELGTFDVWDAYREGFHGEDALDAFKNVWIDIHPRRGFDPSQKVYAFNYMYIGQEVITYDVPDSI